MEIGAERIDVRKTSTGANGFGGGRSAIDRSFGVCELQGHRPSQEDAFILANLTTQRSPEELGQVLKEVYAELHKEFREKHPDDTSGTTAATTIIDKNKIIHANLADTVAFVALYDAENKLLGVKRLTTQLHKPLDPVEFKRITDAGGIVHKEGRFANRVNLDLAVARAIGDKEFETYLSREPQVGIYDIEGITRSLSLDLNHIKRFEVITTCDGFTEPVDKGHTIQKEHHGYLSACISEHQKENEYFSWLHSSLAEKAFADGSQDNITVMVGSFSYPNSRQVVHGVFDGHGGSTASEFVVNNFGKAYSAAVAKYNQSQADVVQPIPSEQNLATKPYTLDSNLKILALRIILAVLLVAAILTIIAFTANMGAIPAINLAVNSLNFTEKMTVVAASAVTSIALLAGLAATKYRPGLFFKVRENDGADSSYDLHTKNPDGKICDLV